MGLISTGARGLSGNALPTALNVVVSRPPAITRFAFDTFGKVHRPGGVLVPRTRRCPAADQPRLCRHLRTCRCPSRARPASCLHARARSIVESGTSFGISTLYLVSGLRVNGGGRLTTSEFESSKVARARSHLKADALDDLVEIREGDALQTLRTDLPESIDLLRLDGAKAF